jgi:hypothetical protein
MAYTYIRAGFTTYLQTTGLLVAKRIKGRKRKANELNPHG